MNNTISLCLLFLPIWLKIRLLGPIPFHKGNNSECFTKLLRDPPVTSAMWEHSRLLVEMQPDQNQTRVEG